MVLELVTLDCGLLNVFGIEYKETLKKSPFKERKSFSDMLYKIKCEISSVPYIVLIRKIIAAQK